MSADTYDVAIVGGGPAGAATALVCASPGLRTIVLEAARAPCWKPGEALAPECNPILTELGLWSSLATRRDLAVSSAGVGSCWGSQIISYRDGFSEPRGAGWIIDRVAFETLLSQRAIAAGADWAWGARVRSATRQAGGWRIDSTGVVNGFVQARLLIDATGRPANLARRLGGRRIRHWALVATVARWPTEGSQSSWINIESDPDGWWYAAATPGGAQILARFGDPTDAGQSVEDILAAVDATRFLKSTLAPPPRTEAVRITVSNAESASLDRSAGEDWLAVGDAAAAFDPIASQGLSHALASANAAAYAACDRLQGKREAIEAYATDMSNAYAFYLKGVRRHYRLEQRWAHRHFWKARHGTPHDR